MNLPKSLTVVFSLLASAMALQGQQPNLKITPAALPPGKLLNSAPDFSQWTINSVMHAPAGLHSVTLPPPRHIVVTKTGDIRHVTGIYDGISVKELWIQKGAMAILGSGLERPMIIDHESPGETLFGPYLNRDFPGFEWISPQNFAGITKNGDRVYLVFEERGTDGAVACIDYETRLPVYLKLDWDESTYQFNAPPTQPLAIPKEVEESITTGLNATKNLTKAPDRP